MEGDSMSSLAVLSPEPCVLPSLSLVVACLLCKIMSFVPKVRRPQFPPCQEKAAWRCVLHQGMVRQWRSMQPDWQPHFASENISCDLLAPSQLSWWEEVTMPGLWSVPHSASPSACMETWWLSWALGRWWIVISWKLKTTPSTKPISACVAGCWILRETAAFFKDAEVTVTSSPSSTYINLRESQVLKGYLVGNGCSVKGYSSLTEIAFLLLNIIQSGWNLIKKKIQSDSFLFLFFSYFQWGIISSKIRRQLSRCVHCFKQRLSVAGFAA